MPKRLLATALILSVVATATPAQPPNERRAVVELIEDDSEGLIKQLNNDGGLDATQIRQEFRDVYSGASSIRVTPFQRFSANIQGWNYPIVEKPQAGQYRFLRFAWKRLDKGGEQVGIMIQLHSNGSWNQRFFSGFRSNQTATWGAMIQVSPEVPREWTVVTRDLFKDFGAMTVQGFAMTPMENGIAGLFDHVYLGQSIEDLDRASADAFGKTPLKEPLTPIQLSGLWDELAKGEMNVVSPALRKLIAGHKESVPYLAKKLSVKPATSDAKQMGRWIDDLDNEDFQLREAAYRELDKLGDAAIRALQEARVKARSVEQRNRIDALLKNRGIEEGTLTTQQLRLVRAVRVLEWAGTAEALSVLESLLKEPPDVVIASDVRQARDRLAKALKR